MSKINGLVELESSYVISQAELKISNIQNYRLAKKKEYIEDYKQVYYLPSWWKFWKGAPVELSDEELWTKLNKEESDRNFFALTPECYLDNFARGTEEDMKMLIKAAKVTQTIMVSVELAAILNTVK